ncbi:uncharacterized protein LOC135170343 [Diachasmimorpha longicaudata]|uniref:uncharacterized protein LOC135170343 n=1 Tax=Diachasmimorpha longicaudata TaxID=58733 RepID=UPI0030B8DAB0
MGVIRRFRRLPIHDNNQTSPEMSHRWMGISCLSVSRVLVTWEQELIIDCGTRGDGLLTPGGSKSSNSCCHPLLAQHWGTLEGHNRRIGIPGTFDNNATRETDQERY